jgi:uncharacterized protein with HEPN domain
MSDRAIILLLQDINEACEHIEQYVRNIDYEYFISNTMVKDAVERNIEIIGEACNMLPVSFQKSYSYVQWHKPIGMRNRLIHGYFAVDTPMLWNTATVIIPEFKSQIEKLINEYSKQY